MNNNNSSVLCDSDIYLAVDSNEFAIKNINTFK